jgi:hypothetical protein
LMIGSQVIMSEDQNEYFVVCFLYDSCGI